MQYLRYLTALALLGAASFTAQARDTRQRVFDPHVRTLKVQQEGNFYAPPLYELGSDQSVCISFDILASEREYLRYSLTHCDPDWRPSGLLDSDILDGFNEAPLSDYAYSSATFVPYVNYRLCIPNADMAPLLSGNYLLRVYPESAPDSTLLQARFSVVEPRASVTGSVSSLTDRGNNDIYQQLSLVVDLGSYRVNDPFSELEVRVEQNGIDVTPVQPIRPLRTEPARLVYEHVPGLIFPAGNEYRRFETVRTDYAGMHVKENHLNEFGFYSATLQPDAERASRPYTYDRTQHSRFKVDEYNATDPDLGADYLLTRFTLDFPRLMNGSVMLDGEFARPLPEAERTMDYNEQTGLYEKELLLKQGSYNYQYVARPSGRPASEATPSPIEGDHFETSNEYVVRLYHRAPGSRYARLIAAPQLVSN